METTLDIQSAMAEMRRNGATYKQIAAEFHYSEGGVLYILRKTPNTHKIQETAMAEMRRNGATYKQIAAEFHYTPSGVQYILRKTPNTHKIQETAEMVKMYQNGFSSVKIAKKFGMNTKTVLNRLHKAGCSVNQCRYAKHYDDMVKMYYDGLTAEQIAEKIGCNHTNVLRILKLRGITPRRTDSNLPINSKIKNLYESGLSVTEIGRQVGMERTTVDYRLCKMGCKAARISQTGGNNENNK